MKFDKNSLDKPWVAYTVAACAAVLLYAAITHLYLVLRVLRAVGVLARPVFIGLILAYVLDPLARLIEKKLFPSLPRKLQRTLSVFLTLACVILFLVILTLALAPQIRDSVTMFLSNLTIYIRSLQLMLRRLNQTALGWGLDLSSLINSSDSLLNQLGSDLPGSLRDLAENFYNIGMGFAEGVVSCILAVYFLAAKDSLLNGNRRLLRALVNRTVYEKLIRFSVTCNVIMVRYIAFSLVDAIIVGMSNFVFMLIAQMPYSVLVSFLVAVFNLAPTFGPIVGGILGALFLLLVKPRYALLFLLFTLVIQTIDGYVIKPRLFGDQLGVPAVWILVSLIVFGRILGVLGILIAIPFSAITDYTYRNILLPRLERRRRERDRKGKS